MRAMRSIRVTGTDQESKTPDHISGWEAGARDRSSPGVAEREARTDQRLREAIETCGQYCTDIRSAGWPINRPDHPSNEDG